MRLLSALDALFLQLETPEMPMHVGALNILELPAGFRGSFATTLRRHLEQRLPLLPALRRRVWWMPLNLASPAWVDAEPDLAWHVAEHRLPAGAGLPEMEDLVGQLHPVLLDRARPLWRFHVVLGLAPGPRRRRRVGLYSQLHHAAVDGQAAVALAKVLLDLTPEPRPPEVRPSSRPRELRLSLGQVLRGTLTDQARQWAGLARGLPQMVQGAAQALAGGGGLKGNLTLAPATPMNVSVGTGRSFAAASLPLAELKALGRAHGATLNDLVLWLCGSALRQFLQERGSLPRKSLVAAVPVSLRAQGDGRADNQASMTAMSLGTHLASPARRLAHVLAASRAMKAALAPVKSALPTDLPSLGLPWLVQALVGVAGRAKLADRLPQLVNVVISNVPGPTVPLYLAGARMLCNHPTSIVVHGIALNITVESFDQHLDFGLMADAQALPDVRRLAALLHPALDELRALPRPATPT